MLNYERQYFKLRVVSQKKKGIGYPNPHHFYEFLTKVAHYLTAVKKKIRKRVEIFARTSLPELSVL